MATGKLKTSNRRQITGRNAMFVGIGLVVSPILILAATYSGIAISRGVGSTAESADTHGNIFGVLLLSLVAILFARNVKRLSEPIIAVRSNPNSDFGLRDLFLNGEVDESITPTDTKRYS